MPRFGRSDIAVAALIAAALVFGSLGFAGFSDKASNSLLFVAWSLMLLTLFMLAIRGALVANFWSYQWIMAGVVLAGQF